MPQVLLVAALTACGTANAGSGALTFELRYIDVGHPSASVLMLDHDGDGALDLLVSGGESVTVLRGDGSGEFELGEVVEAGEHPVDLAAGDLDRERLRVYTGQGNGSFEPAEPVPVGGDPYRGMTIADLDGDGPLDVIT